MPNAWLLKTEPSIYSYYDLEREGRTTWDGVRNPVALRHLSAMAKGDQVLLYHTGEEKAIVGIVRIRRAAYPDPAASDPRRLVVDLEPVRRLPRPVTLAQVKADPQFARFPLVRIPRLSVMPVTPDEWQALLALAGA
jgi:predicted RNA-binding protein with PUA-like domain